MGRRFSISSEDARMERALRKSMGMKLWDGAVAEPEPEPEEEEEEPQEEEDDERKMLRRLFNDMDKDGDGTLGRAEVAGLCKEINRRVLSETELDAAVGAFSLCPPQPTIAPPCYRCSKKRVARFSKTLLGPEVRGADGRGAGLAQMEAMDDDGDGEIDFEEFVKWWHEN